MIIVVEWCFLKWGIKKLEYREDLTKSKDQSVSEKDSLSLSLRTNGGEDKSFQQLNI